MKNLVWNSTFKKLRSWHLVPPIQGMEKVEAVTGYTFSGSKITVDSDWSHEVKTLAPWKESYDKPRQHIKSRDITLLTKVHIVKAMVFPVIMYWCKSWTLKNAEHRRIDAFELWCFRRLLRILWTAWRSNQSVNPDRNQSWIFIGRTNAKTEAAIL